jgi:hypothetical protein
MNGRRMQNKVRQDAERVKKDLNILQGDSIALLNSLEYTVSQTTGDLPVWVEGSVSQLSDGVEKLADDAMETVTKAATTVKKDIGHGLTQYNTKAQKVIEKVPGDLNKKAAKYPWVLVSFALVMGILSGSFLNFSQSYHRQD